MEEVQTPVDISKKPYRASKDEEQKAGASIREVRTPT